MGTKTLERAAVSVADEKPHEIEPSGVMVNDAGQVWRNVMVRCPKEMIADDLRSPKVWKRVQGSRMAALIKLDHLFVLGFDESWSVRATVTHATSTEAHLAIEKVSSFREQGQSLWSDGTLGVYWDGSSYGVRRVADGVRILSEGFLTEAQAADAARRSYPTKVA